MTKATIEDVAEKAGVSVATVNRVLKDRNQVRTQSAEAVEAAIRALNYFPDRLAARLAKGRDYRFCFILPEGDNVFMQSLAGHVKTYAQHFAQERMQADVLQVDVFNPALLAEAISAQKGYDGLAIVALDHPLVREAIADVTAAGVAVVTLVSDVPGSLRQHFVGIDNAAAGRTAASLMGKMLAGKKGKVAVVAGALALRDHAERHLGFTQVMQAEFPRLLVLPVLEGHDVAARNQILLQDLLRDHDDVIGIYSLGAGNAGVIAIVEMLGRAPDVVLIAHELDAASRKALLIGTVDFVIAQSPGHEVRSALRLLAAHCDKAPIIEDMERISIDIYVRDNLP